MGLRVATFAYTNNFGQSVNVFLTWAGLDIKWRESNYIRFNAYASAADSQISPPFERFAMPVSQQDIESLLSENGNVGLTISDKSWELAQTTPFILDYALVTETGRQGEMKSLADLGAQIIDIAVKELATEQLEEGREINDKQKNQS